jgi:hypothetical protein
MKHLLATASLSLLLWHSAASATVVMDLKFSGIDWEGDNTPVDATVRLTFASTNDLDASTSVGAYTASASLLSGAASGNAISPVIVTVTHNAGGPDAFAMSEASFPAPFVDVDGQPVSAIQFTLNSSTGAMFSSDALPTDGSFAAKADFVALVLTHADTPQGFPLDPPQVNVFTPVPEPSCYALLAIGLVLLLGRCAVSRRKTQTLQKVGPALERLDELHQCVAL